MAAKYLDIYATHPTSTEQANQMSVATTTAGGTVGVVKVMWDDALPIDKLVLCIRAAREEIEARGIERGMCAAN